MSSTNIFNNMFLNNVIEFGVMPFNSFSLNFSLFKNTLKNHH
ncbi:hypothetical protein HPHPA11_0745 [Helicobacter pylori Hp A-11]|uniref:Uncharacterized protein n=1 Tax=Helicobacter pylori Hp A-11 TaxID=992035 RepID=N4T8Y4_HELPX|nr:hypothetical protein HPHPA11_0745 [Helicobacter pylori Hp A-11]